ncbi:hypothetical protein [Ralstonia phage RP13]|nr:hypothetical protein [Ralstonia phage RP13]
MNILLLHTKTDIEPILLTSVAQFEQLPDASKFDAAAKEIIEQQFRDHNTGCLLCPVPKYREYFADRNNPPIWCVTFSEKMDMQVFKDTADELRKLGDYIMYAPLQFDYPPVVAPSDSTA